MAPDNIVNGQNQVIPAHAIGIHEKTYKGSKMFNLIIIIPIIT